MNCDKCGEEAVMHAAYSGLHLCQEHLVRSVDKRVRRRIREDGLVPDDATPDDPTTWVIGLSGGKDSVVLTKILDDTFAKDPRIEMIALSIHEGIEGYRDESLDACEELTADLDIRHEVVTYEDEFDLQMDNVVEKDPENMAPCAYCGVFRRDVLSRYAEEYDADLMLTGHNLDDEAETALMNFLEGNVEQMAKHFDASLGPLDERTDQDHHVPRAKPLRDVPEKEVALYAQKTTTPGLGTRSWPATRRWPPSRPRPTVATTRSSGSVTPVAHAQPETSAGSVRWSRPSTQCRCTSQTEPTLRPISGRPKSKTARHRPPTGRRRRRGQQS